MTERRVVRLAPPAQRGQRPTGISHGTPHETGHEAGQVAGLEIVPLSLLIFVAGALLLANAWAVIDAKMVASAAASRAARAYAETPAGFDSGRAWSQAAAAGAETFAAAGLPTERVGLTPAVEPGPLRCARVVVEAWVEVPRLVVPWLGGFGRGLDVHARHSELVDPFRSGLDGAGCV